MVLPAQEKTLNPNNSKRNPAPLAPGLDRNLFSYALAASSAGVALLACAQPAEATVVATKVNIAVPANSGLIQFDINGDGVMDFGLAVTSYIDCPTSARRYNGGAKVRPNLLCASIGRVTVDAVQPADQTVVEGVWRGGHCAAAMGKGVPVGSSRNFQHSDLAMGFFSGISAAVNTYCNFVGSHPKHYLGVKFRDTSGDMHYGWVRVVVQQFRDQFSATITGYAYETEPDQPIITGAISGSDQADAAKPAEMLPQVQEAATLGRLAQGAAGLMAWRRDDEVVAA
jgi:hypothetical protein